MSIICDTSTTHTHTTTGLIHKEIMGNLQSGGGIGGEGGKVPQASMIDAIAKASREAQRIREEKFRTEKHDFDSGSSSSDDDDDETEDSSQLRKTSNKRRGSFDKSITRERNPNKPWLISSREEIDHLIEEGQNIKSLCQQSYPGPNSSYLEKIKWAEAVTRKIDMVNKVGPNISGHFLRDIVLETSPNNIIVQVLVRKRSLKYIVTEDEEIAKAFFFMFEGGESKSLQAGEKNANHIPDYILRPNAPSSVHNESRQFKDRLKDYLKWISEESDSGTILSQANSSKKQASSPLTCLFYIKGNKDTLLSAGVVEPIKSVLKVISKCKVLSIGPSRLPPKFMTTYLNVESDSKIGCLPHFPSPLLLDNIYESKAPTKHEVMCAAIEIVVSTPSGDLPTMTDAPSIGMEISQVTPSYNISHRERLQSKLIRLKKICKNRTFFLVDTNDFAQKCSEKDNEKLLQESSETNIEFIWLSNYFDHCFPRIQEHCLAGRDEGKDLKSRLLLDASGQNDSKRKIESAHCKFELLESNLDCLITNTRKLSRSEQLCEVLALTLVIAFGDHSWVEVLGQIDSGDENYVEFFEDLATFWRSKNQEDDIGLGLSKELDVEGVGDEIKSVFSRSRLQDSKQALQNLLHLLQKKIQSSYKNILQADQKLDFTGSSSSLTKDTELSKTQPSKEIESKKRLHETENMTVDKKQRNN